VTVTDKLEARRDTITAFFQAILARDTAAIRAIVRRVTGGPGPAATVLSSQEARRSQPATVDATTCDTTESKSNGPTMPLDADLKHLDEYQDLDDMTEPGAEAETEPIAADAADTPTSTSESAAQKKGGNNTKNNKKKNNKKKKKKKLKKNKKKLKGKIGPSSTSPSIKSTSDTLAVGVSLLDSHPMYAHIGPAGICLHELLRVAYKHEERIQETFFNSLYEHAGDALFHAARLNDGDTFRYLHACGAPLANVLSTRTHNRAARTFEFGSGYDSYANGVLHGPPVPAGDFEFLLRTAAKSGSITVTKYLRTRKVSNCSRLTDHLVWQPNASILLKSQLQRVTLVS
jgi:hypothetical protein